MADEQRIVKAYGLGSGGVNTVKSPIHLDDNELTKAVRENTCELRKIVRILVGDPTEDKPGLVDRVRSVERGQKLALWVASGVIGAVLVANAPDWARALFAEPAGAKP